LVRELLELAGIGQDRLHLRYVSSSEGRLFADYVTELTDLVQRAGPLQAEELRLPLAAVHRALNTPALRWLLGLERQLTEKENVFHEKLDAEAYHQVLQRTALEAYQKALIFETLKAEAKTVPEIAAATGLPVYTVSLRLNDLERTGMATFQDHVGNSPRFGATAE
jgi:F420-non-reducing hydrogenase iron-sulfur subunit